MGDIPCRKGTFIPIPGWYMLLLMSPLCMGEGLNMLAPELIMPPGRELTDGGLDRGCGPCEGGFEYG